MSAYVDSDGTVNQLDGRAEPDEVITADDVKDADKLSRMLARVLREIAAIKRRHWPQRVVFRDVAITGTTMSPQTKRFAHGLGGRVHWWSGGWTSGSTSGPHLRQTTATTDDELVLETHSTGTFTLIVEEAG